MTLHARPKTLEPDAAGFIREYRAIGLADVNDTPWSSKARSQA